MMAPYVPDPLLFLYVHPYPISFPGLGSKVFQRTKGPKQGLTIKKSSPSGATVPIPQGLGVLGRHWGEVPGGFVLTEAVGSIKYSVFELGWEVHHI